MEGTTEIIYSAGTNETFWDELLTYFLDFMDFSFAPQPWYAYVANSLLSLFCVVFAGLMSGLTLGLLSFDRMTLQIYMTTGTKRVARQAARIEKLVRHHHWLLCTLLIANALAMEALPIFLDALLPKLFAVLISVSFILLFGEIIPQALCSRYGLWIGATSYLLVIFLMIITAPISWPTAKLLDCLLGKNHVTFFRRAQLKELVSLHGKDGKKKKTQKKKKFGKKGIMSEAPLTNDEITVIRGALELSSKTVQQVMTKVDVMFMLEFNEKLTRDVMKSILKSGHSRIPVYEGERNNIKGLLIVKNLILLDPDDEIPISKCTLRKSTGVREDYPLYKMLNFFQEGRSHMALVYQKEQEMLLDFSKDKYKNIIGVCTLEDVIEELIKEEIVDETDIYVDMNTHLKVADGIRNLSMLSSASSKRGKNFIVDAGVGGEKKEDIVIDLESEEKNEELDEKTPLVKKK